ncbi:VMAP-C domain-containing protein [Streptantibioticus silvisoli]|uniref:Trypsin-like peptidase domain-containing protein n=1 Tax=Streptantibioticus silvisoli TaxID=2705255 RepID=A0ABT6W6V8_9ACTN|nr:trypsin-like peptidase domain-containing protein [Streptantibioticus silvisoli]MDI5966485.1 trypsin-like peptidase domain-containing protein [Streptantibioticus silvisoli]
MPEAEGRLRELAREVTVAVHAAPHEEAEFWGSGLLVAPRWVLTCAHVLVRRDSLGRRHWAAGDGVGVRVGGRVVPGAVVYTLPSPDAITHGWDPGDDREFEIFPDLALIRLTAPVEHGCAWLSDRAVPPVTRTVAALGWRRTRDELWTWDGTCDVVGNDGVHVFRLGPDSEIPAGVSGSLVVDLAHGRVIGVVKARRRNRDGGKAVRLTALRGLAGARPLVPELSLGPDPYQQLVREHDRWHFAQQRLLRAGRSTWIDVQGRLDTVIGEWTPYDRAEALGLLAELPPPRSTGVVQRLVERVLGPGTVRDPLPVAWRDGHGLLYEPESGKQLLAFVTYLLLVAREVQGQDALAAGELRDFATRRAMSLPAPDRTRLAGLDVPGPGARRSEQGSSVLVALAPVVWEENRPVRFRWEIQLVRSAHDRQITTVCDQRDGVAFDEAVAQVQEPLALALDRADESGRPATVEVALPVHHFDTAVHLWVPGTGLPGRPHRPARPMGTRRPVVLRDVERVPPPPEWRERWRLLTGAGRLTALPLPAGGHGPGYEELRHAEAGAVPVLCGRVGGGAALETMMDVLDAGHGVALWLGAPHPPDGCGTDCDTFRRAAAALLERAGGPAGLPEAVRASRAEAHDHRPGAMDAARLMLLYDDADLPLPGSWAGDLPAPR